MFIVTNSPNFKKAEIKAKKSGLKLELNQFLWSEMKATFKAASESGGKYNVFVYLRQPDLMVSCECQGGSIEGNVCYHGAAAAGVFLTLYAAELVKNGRIATPYDTLEDITEFSQASLF